MAALGEAGAGKERNYGVDLLRMISMLMVCGVHVLGQGSVLSSLSEGTFRYAAAWLLEAACIGAVNCYALISGYVGVEAKFKISNIVKLWLQAVFVCLGVTLGFFFFLPGSVGKAEWVAALTPVTSQQYWYLTAYFCLFFFIPFLNQMVNALTPKQRNLLMAAIFVLFTLFSTLLRVDLFGTNFGYSALWLILLYLFGGCLKKNGGPVGVPRWVYACVFLAMVVLSWAGLNFRFMDYTSPTVLVGSICLLLFFAGAKISAPAKKLIGILSPLTFGVYLLHVNPLVWNKLLYGRFAFFAQYNPFVMLACVFLAMVVIYCGCSLVEAGRFYLFKLLGVGKFCRAIDRICGRLSAEPRPEESVDRAFESALPERYVPVKRIDAKRTQTVILFNAVALAITCAAIAAAYFQIRPNFLSFNDPGVMWLKVVLFLLALLAYLVLHELTHGVVYKVETKGKLAFGLALGVAFCGVPDLYVYRRTALRAVLAPFIIFTLAFGALAVFLPVADDRFLAAVLLGLHLGGCVGDLYLAGLLLFRYRSPALLVRDTGPVQSLYLRQDVPHV